MSYTVYVLTIHRGDNTASVVDSVHITRDLAERRQAELQAFQDDPGYQGRPFTLRVTDRRLLDHAEAEGPKV